MGSLVHTGCGLEKTQKPGQSRWAASMERKRIRLRRHQLQKVGTATGVKCVRGHVKPKSHWMRGHACVNLNRKWSLSQSTVTSEAHPIGL